MLPFFENVPLSEAKKGKTGFAIMEKQARYGKKKSSRK